MVQIQYSVHKYPIHAPIIAKFFPTREIHSQQRDLSGCWEVEAMWLFNNIFSH